MYLCWQCRSLFLFPHAFNVLLIATGESAEELRSCREEGRPSVFDRLTNGNNHRVEEGRTKMRMDSVPASLVDSGTLSYEDSEAAATPSIFVVGNLPSFRRPSYSDNEHHCSMQDT